MSENIKSLKSIIQAGNISISAESFGGELDPMCCVCTVCVGCFICAACAGCTY